MRGHTCCLVEQRKLSPVWIWCGQQARGWTQLGDMGLENATINPPSVRQATDLSSAEFYSQWWTCCVLWFLLEIHKTLKLLKVLKNNTVHPSSWISQLFIVHCLGVGFHAASPFHISIAIGAFPVQSWFRQPHGSQNVEVKNWCPLTLHLPKWSVSKAREIKMFLSRDKPRECYGRAQW